LLTVSLPKLLMPPTLVPFSMVSPLRMTFAPVSTWNTPAEALP
jgi:hypothetical protein